jgi:hypothetical protein
MSTTTTGPPQVAEPKLEYHEVLLDLPPDGCYLFTFVPLDKTYSNALMVRSGRIVGLTEYVPIILATSEDNIGGLVISLPDGTQQGDAKYHPRIIMRLQYPEKVGMRWEPLMPIADADMALQAVQRSVNAVVEEFLDRPGHCGPVQSFAEISKMT